MFNIQTIRKARVNQPLYRDLVAYWQMSEASGTRADSVQGLDLTDNNGVGTVAGVNNTTAASFDTTKSLSRASENAIQLGDFDFTFAGWVYTTIATSSPVVFGKWSNSQAQVLLYFEPNQMRWVVSPTSNASGAIGVFANGSQVSNTWYFVTVWHDSVNDLAGIAINNGAAATSSYSLGIYSAGTIALRFGLDEEPSPQNLTGRLQRWGYWRRVLSASDRAALYNAGSGLNYPLIPS